MRTRSILALAIATTVVATFARSAFASWPHDPNTNVPLCTVAGVQSQQSVASDGAGGAIVAWQDTRGSSADIYVQRVGASGAALWTSNGVALCTAAGTQANPVIIPDGVGGAIVVWSDSRTGGGDIYAQRVNAAGVPQWTANGVALCTAVGDQYEPTIASDGANGAIVTWEDGRSFFTWDIYVQRVNAAGVPQWTANGVALCTAGGDQLQPVVVSDAAGGAIVAWNDTRGGNRDLYAQRVNAAGTPQWAANGVVLCNQNGEQYNQTITTDSAGGAIVAWQDNRFMGDYDIYAQRITPAGVTLWGSGAAIVTASYVQGMPVLVSDGAGGAIIAWNDERNGNDQIVAQRVNGAGIGQWTVNGVFLANNGLLQYFPTIATDGQGGAILAWQDYRFPSIDVFAQRVSATGALLWGTYGTPISTAVGDQDNPRIVEDGAGGAILAWYDNRVDSNSDIYAQRVERFGKLGNPEPAIVNVGDVPGDQGGKINIRWNASYLDVAPSNPIATYWIWRQVPATAASSALRGGARLYEQGSTTATPRKGSLRAMPMGAQTYYWEFVGSQVSRGFPGYSYTTSTFSDSVAAGNPYTLFMVEAEQTSTGYYWDSAPDSGYSVDNLAPAAPAPFTAAYSGGGTHLAWGANTEPDLASYRLYRGSSAGFTPGSGNRIAAPSGNDYVDVGPPGSYYKLSAVDVHGNESGFSLITPSQTTAVGDGSPVPFALEGVLPNPNAGKRLDVHFALPTGAPARLELLDAAGRQLSAREVGELGAGRHSLDLSAGRRLSPGIYWVRLVQGSRRQGMKVAVIG